jgi:hypothetical protein
MKNYMLLLLVGLLAVAVVAPGCGGNNNKGQMIVKEVASDVTDDVAGDFMGELLVDVIDEEMPPDITPDEIPDDKPEDLDIQEDEYVPPPPELSFCIGIPDGCTDGVTDCLTLDDDMYEAAMGLQVDIHVTVANIPGMGEPNGPVVELWIDESMIGDAMQIPAEQFSFNQVTLTHKPTGHVIEVRIPDVANAQMMACANTGQCGVTVTPLGGACYTEDEDADTDGIQATFTVTNDDTDCDQAWITIGEESFPAEPATLVDGTVDILVTLDAADAGQACVDGSMVGHVGDSNAPDREAQTDEMTFTVDTTIAEIIFTDPTAANVNLGNDEDEVEDGIQITVAGTITNAASSDLFVLTVNDEEVEASTVGTGEFEFTVTLSEQSIYSVEATVTDCCESIGQASFDIFAVFKDSNLTIETPDSGDDFLALDNGPLGTEYVFDLTFTVDAPTCGVDDTIEIACHEDVPGAFSEVYGAFTITELADDWQYDVATLIDVQSSGNKTLCQAQIQKNVNAVSPEIALTIGLPAPQLVILDPEEGELLDPQNFMVSGTAAELTGQMVTVTIEGNEEKTWDITVDADELFNLAEALVGLVDGPYTLTGEATDIWGNVASLQAGSMTQVSFYLDSMPPMISYLDPTDGFVCTPPACVDAIDDDVMPGHQIEVSVLVENEVMPGDTSVCLTTNGTPVSPCLAPVAAGEEWIATFPGVTLIPGDNVLSAQATDGLGHAGGSILAGINLAVNAPRVTFISPPKDIVTATEPFSVVVFVSSADGLTPLEDAEVTITVGGVDTDMLDVGVGGTYQFEVSGLTPNVPTFIQVRANHTDYTDTGYSMTRKATLKDTAPAIALTYPDDAAVYNKAAVECAVGVAGCQLTVTATTVHVEDEQVAVLTLTCGINNYTYDADIITNEVLWEDVTIPNNSNCTLTAEVEDAVGQLAVSAPVNVTVDRTAPSLTEFTAPKSTLVPYTYDLDPEMEGFQYIIKALVAGIEAGQQISLEIVADGEETQSLVYEVTESIPDNSEQIVEFPEYSFIGGLSTLTASVQDAAGNSALITKDVMFFTDTTEVRFSQGDSVEFVQCDTSDDCGIGICAPLESGMRCTTPWKAAKQLINVVSLPTELFSGQEYHLCSNNPDLVNIADGICEDTSGGTFRIIKEGTLVGGWEGIQFSKNDVEGLPQGEHSLFYEALSKGTEGGDPVWMSSTISPFEDEQFKALYVDTVPPVLGTISFPGDLQAPSGWLNATEAVEGAQFKVDMTVTGAAMGILNYSINDISQDPVFLSAEDPQALSLTTTFYQGSNTVCATSKDLVGNASAEECTTANVDTFPPNLSFTYPVNEAVLLVGSSADVKVITEPGLEVELEKNLDGLISTIAATANIQGVATFSAALAADGVYSLEATTTDDAGNITSIDGVPSSFVVDRSPPILSVQSPTGGATFGTNDDADPGSEGYQVQVAFEVTDSSIWNVQTLRCPDGTYTECMVPVEKSQGSQEGQISTNVTIGKLLQTTEYRIVRITATDTNGNSVEEDRKIIIQPGDCIVAFTNLPEATYLNNSYCSVSGEDCESTTLDISVIVAGACGDSDSLVFYVDDMPVNQSADFQDEEVIFPVTVNHGDEVVWEAKLLLQGADTGKTTGSVSYTADFTDPIPVFVSPSENPFLCNSETDLNIGQAGCQFSSDITVTGDNLIGGQATISRTLGETSTLLQEVTIDAETFDYSFASLSLPEADNQMLVLAATDLAGNSAESSITAHSDVTPPAAISLNDIDPVTDIDQRRPSVRLTWTAVGDDGTEGTAATQYEFRYAITPIANDADFDAACDPTEITSTGDAPAPAPAGSLESFDITGPDIRPANDPCRMVVSPETGKTYWFAAQAVDNAGNKSEIANSSIVTTDELSLRYSKVSAEGLNAPNLGSAVFSLGDINGDGLSEFAVGGDSSYPGFCMIKGTTTPPEEYLLANADADSDIVCIVDEFSSWAGFAVIGLGDVNGDGYRDVASQVFATTADVWSTHYRIYLGNAAGLIDPTPAVRLLFTGQDYWKGAVASAGNFNGDTLPNGNPINDIIVSAPSISSVYIVPGNIAWKTAAPVDINLLDQTALNTWNVFSINGLGMIDENGKGRFGSRLNNAENVISDGDGAPPQYSEILISKTESSAAVYLVKGRAFETSQTVTISADLDNSGTDDANVVKLEKDDVPNTGGTWFGWELPGAAYIDDDDIIDVVVYQLETLTFNRSQLYVFSGASIAEALGQSLQVAASQSMGSGVYLGDNGFRIQDSTSFITLLGNFDNAPSNPNKSIDIAYGSNEYAPPSGTAYVRLNQQELASDNVLYPSVDITMSDPFDPDNIGFAAYQFAALRDFNGDGTSDLLIPSDNVGYSVLVY